MKKKADKNRIFILEFRFWFLCIISILCVFCVLLFINVNERGLNKAANNRESQKYNLSQSNKHIFLPFTNSLNEYYSEMVNEKWRLKRIFKKGDYCYAFVESENRNELYILMKENSTSTVMFSYIIGADIIKNAEGEISFNYMYSYNSDLKWQPYDMNKEYSVNAYVHQIDYVFDSIYGVGGHYALLAYLELIGMNEETHWSIDENWLYVGTNGSIAYITFFNDDHQVDLLIDVWNDKFAVLKGIDS